MAISGRMETLDFVDWARLASSLVSGCLVFAGVVLIRKSRLAAFKMFERSIMVSIFFTQVFVFYEEQFGALVGLFIDLMILVALRFVIYSEEFLGNKPE